MSYLTTNIKFKDSNLIDIKAEETFVGWYLGEKLYRKVIDYSGIVNKNYTSIPHGIENFKKCIFANATSDYDQNDYIIPYFLGATLTVVHKVNGENIIIYSKDTEWATSNWKIILYYTKNE